MNKNNDNNNRQIKDNEYISVILEEYGLSDCKKITDSLQGSVWSCKNQQDDDKKYVIKVTNRELHKRSSIKLGDKEFKIQENIKKEAKILKYVSLDNQCPDTIIKYVDFFKSTRNYYLVMENGGYSLFDFVVKAHNLILIGKLDIKEWQKCVKVIFKQIIDTIYYLHSKNICHFDISLENILINDVDVVRDLKNMGKITFCTESIKIKIIDFGLAEYFKKDDDDKDKEGSGSGGNKNTTQKCVSFMSSKYCGKENYKSPEIVAKNKLFDAKANDIWCAGVCLFMMVIGSAPWNKASNNDNSFTAIINNQMVSLIDHWDRLEYININILSILTMIFKYENKRCSINEIINSEWLK